MIRKVRGFTLIEMLIVIVVLSILMLVVIPRLLSAGRRAKESALKDDLRQLRKAIQQFEADCGDYPASLNQLVQKPAADSNGGNGINLDLKKWKGPYLSRAKVPVSPFWEKGASTKEEAGSAGNGWDYEPTTGKIQSACDWEALDLSKYRDW